jgi:PTS system nitrogen regulatory IIA component
MQISELLTPERTLNGFQGCSKKRILETISQLAASEVGQDNTSDIITALVKRERLGSTGVGNGIALPHGRMTGLEKPIGVLITTEDAIDFDAIDDQPVNIFFAMLVPESDANCHLTTLATIAEKFNDKEVVKAMRNAQTNQQLFSIATSKDSYL